MNQNKLTEKTREIVNSACGFASDMGHQRITDCHVLKALVDESDGFATRLITEARRCCFTGS